MKAAVYTNRATGETKRIVGENIDLEKAWGSLLKFACNSMDWNYDMANYDVIVKVVDL